MFLSIAIVTCQVARPSRQHMENREKYNTREFVDSFVSLISSCKYNVKIETVDEPFDLVGSHIINIIPT